MTEINEEDEPIEHPKLSKKFNIVLSSIKSDLSEDVDENLLSVRPGHDTIERQARMIADRDFAQMERNWDEYMFEHMDESTATFIILRNVHDGM